ncbi:enterotoxin A family protein [Paraburkholderia phosphatilytica]|uniref:enterotoxin A family protein n=1 Tax=Paraburkholderia phosphatilytica TaxID=2282883 RepID=UPI001F0BB42C|nr:enterotoxin A family protein [Paraburkholderia phosphatilytica]
MDQTALEAAAGRSDALHNQCAGLTSLAILNVAAGQAVDLVGATQATQQRLLNPVTRQSTLDEIRRLQTAHEVAPITDVPGFEMRAGGATWPDAASLVDNLRIRFSTRYPSADGLGTAQNTFADVTFRYGDRIGGHAILIQRVGRTLDYLADDYQLYDSNHGVFTYRGFDRLAATMNEIFDHAYQNFGGVDAAQTAWYADPLTWRPYTGVRPDAHRQMMQLAALRAFGAQRTPMLAPTDPELPPPPNFDQPGPSGWDGTHHDFRRSTDAPDPDQPAALFRPSRVTPEELRKQQGFSVDDTSLGNVNLDLHDSIVSGHPAAVDGGGYLGTFGLRDTAQKRLDAMEGKSGYIYDVAPSPNMVDVSGSLGSTHARAPDDREVAAMGRIDYAQIRGWQKVENGKLGNYEANPDYRWDVYDRTRTSGAQPQLAHFSPDDPAWADADHRAFVTPFQQDGKTLYRPNENPALAQARFYQHANADIQQRVSDQANHLDYRGPVAIKPVWNNSGADKPARLNFSSGSASIDRSAASGDADQFRMGDDGRIHMANDDSKVLRIDGQGNAYIGPIPDGNSLNGVFAYEPKSGTLIHAEDGKLLTEGAVDDTPYVAVPQGTNGIMARQQWTLADPSGNAVRPPYRLPLSGIPPLAVPASSCSSTTIRTARCRKALRTSSRMCPA